jgi:hypothetical protein
MQVKFYVFLTSIVDAGKWPASSPAALPPRSDPLVSAGYVAGGGRGGGASLDVVIKVKDVDDTIKTYGGVEI